MKILCAKNVSCATEVFAPLGEVELVDGRRIDRACVRDADALVIRSTTRVDAGLLADSAVKFVGTATVGTDHMDTAYLDSRGIRWCAAPGCNAAAVAEYVMTALLCVSRRSGRALAGRTLGVVGVGNVGRRVVAMASSLGLQVLRNDPPRQAAGDGEGFLPLAELLRAADIVTLHVPLTTAGPWPTRGLAGREFFAALPDDAIFVNAARGPAMETKALREAMASGRVAQAIVDTWEGEPLCDRDLVASVAVATPHIAGHSFDGKVRGTMMVYEQLCGFLDQAPACSVAAELPAPAAPAVRVDTEGLDDEAVLHRLATGVYDLEADVAEMRAGNVEDATARAANFESQRARAGRRREFSAAEATLPGASSALLAKAGGLGFRVTTPTNGQ